MGSVIKDSLLSFKESTDDFLMIVVSILWSVLILVLSPILHLVNRSKTKQFPAPKTIIVTGASSGIGKGIAIGYAAPGVTIGITGRDKNRLDEVKALILEKGANVEVKVIDVNDKEKIGEWVKDFDSRHQVDIVFANAGVVEATLSEDLTYEERVYQLTNTNINGSLNTVLPLLPSFRKRNHGQIVFMSSITSYISYVYPSYVASKAYLTQYSLTLRQELRNYGVGCTTINPGFVLTPMTDALKMDSLPMSVSVDTAVSIIKNGVSKNKAFIGFSRGALIFSYTQSLVPPNLRDAWNLFMNKLVQTVDTIEASKSKDLIKYRSSLPQSLFVKNVVKEQSTPSNSNKKDQ